MSRFCFGRTKGPFHSIRNNFDTEDKNCAYLSDFDLLKYSAPMRDQFSLSETVIYSESLGAQLLVEVHVCSRKSVDSPVNERHQFNPWLQS